MYEVYACDNCVQRFRSLKIPAERSPEALRRRIQDAQSEPDISRSSPPKRTSEAAQLFLSVMRELDREEQWKQNVIDELRKRDKRRSSQPRHRKLSMSKYLPLLQKAGLTDRQMDCMIWKLEGPTVAGIAKKLRIHHSTVQEHIEAALKKIKNNPSVINSLRMLMSPRN